MTERSVKQDTFGFPETRWDLVLAARDSEGARNQLLALYYRPVLAYFRALARHAATAEELRQSFFVAELTRLSGEVERGVVRRADPSKGRFRDYLKKSLRRHWLSSFRGAHDDTLPLPNDEDSWHPTIEIAEGELDRAWVRQMVVIALRSVESICLERGQEKHFAIFTSHYFPASGADPSWEALAVRFGLGDGRTARNRAITVQAHLRPILRDMLLRGRPGADLSQEVLDVLSILGDDDA